MNNKIVLTSTIGLLSIVSIFLLSVSAFATTETGCNEDRQTALIAAYEQQDYEAWVELMSLAKGGKGILRKVTAENFAEFADYKLQNPSAKGNMFPGFDASGTGMQKRMMQHNRW